VVSSLEPGNRLNFFFDPLPHPLSEFFSACTSFQLFVAVDLGLQSFHPGFVLFDPITPLAHALGASFRVELIAPQPKKLFGLLPGGPALLAISWCHDSGAERLFRVCSARGLLSLHGRPRGLSVVPRNRADLPAIRQKALRPEI